MNGARDREWCEGFKMVDRRRPTTSLSQIRPQNDYHDPATKSIHEMNDLSLNFGPILTSLALDITSGFCPNQNILTVQAKI